MYSIKLSAGILAISPVACFHKRNYTGVIMVRLCKGNKAITIRLLDIGIAVGAMGLLAACTPPEPMDFSLGDVAASPHKTPCKLQSIAVTIESNPNYGNGSYGTRPPSLEQLREPMQSALQDGLDRTAAFDFGSQSYCAVEAKILGMKYETAGITFPTKLYVSYMINSLDTGQPILREVIIGQGETPLSYNYLGFVRDRHSIILSGQDAVRGMIDTTEQFAAIEKPLNNPPAITH